MATVTVLGPYANDTVSPSAMRTILQALADGINNIDSTQLGAGCVTTEKVADSAITLAKLTPPWAYTDTLAANYTKTSADANAVYRVGDEANPLTVSVTPDTNVTALLHAGWTGSVNPTTVNATGQGICAMIRNATGNTDVGGTIYGRAVCRYAASANAWEVGSAVFGQVDLDSGTAYKFGLTFQWIIAAGNATDHADVTFYTAYTRLSVLLVPR